MIAAALPRRIATALLQSAISIAPQEALEWGHAMLSELRHVEGNWSALFWSLGSAGVLAKHALVALIFPSRNRSTIPAGGDLFSKEGSMRKPALAVIASCVLASLLFFLAPVFRQAFRISLMQWHDVLHPGPRWTGQESDPELEALARKAEQNHDAEALAFVAIHSPNRAVGVRAASEATRLDSKLTWIYAIVYAGYPPNPETDHWILDLKKFDPQNALPHLMSAQKIGIKIVFSKEFPRGHEEENPGWRDEMAAAFQSANLDTYLDRQMQLDRRIIARYGIEDPFQVFGEFYNLPSYSAWYCERFAESELEAGKTLEARDHKGAAAKYWEVARFGQMVVPRREFFMRRGLKEAYTRLATLARLEGDKDGATFFAMLAVQLDEAWEQQLATWRNNRGGEEVSSWSAFLVRLSGLLMLFSGSLLVLCVAGVMLRNRSMRLTSLRPSRLTLSLAVSSALAALLASAVLFVSYWPYSHALQRFVSAGDESGLAQLSDFLRDSQLPLGSGERVGSWYVGVSEIVFYFWFGVAVLCALTLALGVLRYLQTRARATAA